MHRYRLWAAGGGVAAAVVLAVPAPAALAADSASSTTNITVAVRSVTVDKTQLTCTPALVIPSGSCTTDAVRVVNGQADSHILAKTGPAFASNGQPPNWVPCHYGLETVPSGGTTCSYQTPAGTIPGTDQFHSSLNAGQAHTTLDLEFNPDTSFGSDGAAASNSFITETNTIGAPYASTNPSPSFATGITWMAAP